MLKSLERLSNIISKLPSIGERSANRLAIYLFYSDNDYLKEFAYSLSTLHDNIKICKICFSLSETEICDICSNDKRDKSKICVLASYTDMLAIEKTGEYDGLFHVLGSLIDPLRGIGIDDIKIKELLERTEKNDVKEIILAFSSSLEADTTSSFIYKSLKNKSFNGAITRITYGISLSSDIENADTKSLARSILDRVKLDS